MGVPDEISLIVQYIGVSNSFVNQNFDLLEVLSLSKITSIKLIYESDGTLNENSNGPL